MSKLDKLIADLDNIIDSLKNEKIKDNARETIKERTSVTHVSKLKYVIGKTVQPEYFSKDIECSCELSAIMHRT